MILQASQVLQALAAGGVGTGVTAGLGAGAGAGAAAAPLTGGLSLLLPLLASLGPGILAKLFGGKSKRQQIEELLAQRQAMTDKNYNAILGGPGYSQAQGAIAQGANQTANSVASNLAQRGLGTTGSGAILSGLTPSLVGSQMAKLKTSAYDSASNQTGDELSQRINAITGEGPSQAATQFAGGIESFGPYLQAYMKHRFPGSFDTMTSPTARTR